MREVLSIPRKHLAWLLFAALLAVLQGYHLGVGDLSTYIPFALHEYNPRLFANDLLIETIDVHPVLIWQFAGMMLHYLTLETFFKLLFLLQIVITTFGVYVFYRHFFGNDIGWVIVLLTLVIPSSSAAMGKYGLNPYGYFHPGALAVGMMLIAYTLLDRQHLVAGSLLMGSVFWFHPFTAVYGSLFLGFKFLLDVRAENRWRWLAALSIFLVVAAPSWLPFLIHKLTAPSPAFDLPLWLQITRKRMQFSFYMSQWVPDRFIHLAIAFLGLGYFRRHPAFRKTLPIVLTTLVALTLMGLAEIFSIKFLLQLQLARCSYFLFMLLTFFLANFLMTREQPQRGIGFLFWAILGLALMIEAPTSNPYNPLRWILLAAGAASILFIILKKPAWWKPLYIATGVGMVLLATAVTVFNTYEMNRNWHTMVLRGTLSEFSGKLEKNSRFSLVNALYDRTFTTPWEDIQLWCRSHLPVDEVIMTPVYLEGFRCFSRHAIYGSYKDGAPHNYSEKTFFRWWERMKRMGIDLSVNRDDFPRLYHIHASDAARVAGIRYLVYDKQIVQYEGESLYQNERFGIIDLKSAPKPFFRF